MPPGEDATSSAIAFALAGVLFIAAISTVLVYANDRIPPPSKSRPHDELAAEAKVLLQSYFLDDGDLAWNGAVLGWSDTAADRSAGRYPGLRYCPANPCTGTVVLDRAKIDYLDDHKEDSVGAYDYEEYRQAIGFDGAGRGFNVTVDAIELGTTLLEYGEAPPERTATRPAVAYLQTSDEVRVRITVHVFQVCAGGACLDA